ncbi:peptidase inhibitor family I36 protein [Salinithrix halophila]|uniref:Peptidase inhibitor family I36 protein n=1 Tax=Salinithrix halophila TaxID=1485204 RepID=A0ABV8JFU7_9BACL
MKTASIAVLGLVLSVGMIGSTLFGQPASAETKDNRLPVVLDGTKVSPNSPKVDKAKIFVEDDKAQKQGVVFGFSSKAKAEKYLKEGVSPIQKETSLPISPQQGKPSPTATSSYFFEHAGFGGSWFSIQLGYASSYLGSYWNDRISSLSAASGGNWTILYEHSNYRGKQYWLKSGYSRSNLVDVPDGSGGNWNDKASSIYVY